MMNAGLFSKRIFYRCLMAIAGIFLLNGCSPEETDAPLRPLEGVVHPSHFPARHYEFGDNAYQNEGFDLGRAMFFDPILSADGSVSCQSCHFQKDAFSDGGKALSDGIGGQQTTRNSPAIINMAWSPYFMWDGGITHLEVMPFAPISNPVEMGTDLQLVIDKLNAHETYPYRFRRLFGREEIDDQQLFYVLAQYMANLVSADSRYDRYVLGEGELNTNEIAGLNLFRTHCATCHQEPLFTDFSFQNNGLDEEFADVGRYRVSQDSADMGRFKVPTLRNIELSAPYMHDGRFQTLEEVMDHYTDGMKDSPTLSNEFQRNGRPGIALTDEEKNKLIEFLGTLTDPGFVSDPELREE
jgi:cytochrome c peroxidase